MISYRLMEHPRIRALIAVAVAIMLAASVTGPAFAAVPVQVKNIQTGQSGSRPTVLTQVGGTLFFTATTDQSGSELWKSDGTEVGTVMVKDIVPGRASSELRELVGIGGTLYFVTQTEIHGHELWKSDGTSLGTTILKDVRPALRAGIERTVVNIRRIEAFAVILQPLVEARVIAVILR